MGKKYNLIRTAAMPKRFVCGACEASADLMVNARGESGWHSDGFFDPDPSGKLMLHSAGVDLVSDSGRILALVRCPACGHRSKTGVARSLLRYVLPFGAAVIVSVMIGAVAPRHNLLIGAIAFPICALLAAVDEIRRWREAARCVTGVRSTMPVPKAIAKIVPARPIVPLATQAPAKVERASDDAGPSFLR